MAGAQDVASQKDFAVLTDIYEAHFEAINELVRALASAHAELVHARLVIEFLAGQQSQAHRQCASETPGDD